MHTYNNTSQVEELARQKTGRLFRYAPTEKIDILEVPDFPSLGKLTALRFIEWLQLNLGGVISLPTGKTPEYFIKWTKHYFEHWTDKSVQNELSQWGISHKKPDMRSYSFIQIDEFYPMNPAHENSFAHYIKRFYIDGFGLDPSKVHLLNTWSLGMQIGKNLDMIFPNGLVNLSLRTRHATNELERLQYQSLVNTDQYAMEYEANIESLGGIGFFLGGIGPDGHVGFNVRGSDHFSTTRLLPINYETAASAATDLGGIELARQRLVITIGLYTITKNPTATAIIIAAGESKSPIVKNAIENQPSVLYPATALQKLAGARFYVTEGASLLLCERKRQKLIEQKEPSTLDCESLFIDIAHKKNKTLDTITTQDIKEDFLGETLLEKIPTLDCRKFGIQLIDKIKEKITQGILPLGNTTFLHTAPHHDDIMLGYLPYIVHLVRDASSKHYFATMTSGFTSVSNSYTLKLLENLRTFLPEFEQQNITKGNISDRNRDLYEYLDGIAAQNIHIQQQAQCRRLLRDIMEIIGKEDYIHIIYSLEELKSYLQTSYPGKKDIPSVQTLKGMIREWEEELWWGHLGFDCNHTIHLRLGFYTGDIFTPQPELDRDIKPIIELLRKTDPDIVTVALDPEASGPDTHYKVLQGIAQALKIYLHEKPHKKITVWGYRNVWFRFHPTDANVFVPVSMNSLSILKSAFFTCFGSQRTASFPSYEYDGPFSDLAQKIMVEQYDCIKACIGTDYFHTHERQRMRTTHGFCFIKSMPVEEFFAQSLALKKRIESHGL